MGTGDHQWTPTKTWDPNTPELWEHLKTDQKVLIWIPTFLSELGMDKMALIKEDPSWDFLKFKRAQFTF